MGFIQVLTNRRTGRATSITSASTTQVNTLDGSQTANPLESVGSTEEKKDVIPDEENLPPKAEAKRDVPNETAQRGVQRCAKCGGYHFDLVKNLPHYCLCLVSRFYNHLKLIKITLTSSAACFFCTLLMLSSPP